MKIIPQFRTFSSLNSCWNFSSIKMRKSIIHLCDSIDQTKNFVHFISVDLKMLLKNMKAEWTPKNITNSLFCTARNISSGTKLSSRSQLEKFGENGELDESLSPYYELVLYYIDKKFCVIKISWLVYFLIFPHQNFFWDCGVQNNNFCLHFPIISKIWKHKNLQNTSHSRSCTASNISFCAKPSVDFCGLPESLVTRIGSSGKGPEIQIVSHFILVEMHAARRARNEKRN